MTKDTRDQVANGTPQRDSSFFSAENTALGPAIGDFMIRRAEASLGVRLPRAYVALLRQQNGGTPIRRCFPMTRSTSWAPDHFEVSTLLGLGFEEGIDGEYGSEYLIGEWGYPPIGVVIFDTPSAGHDTVMLDYRTCGSDGEPPIAYIDEDRNPVVVAPNFDVFVDSLVDCARFRRHE